MSLPYKELHPKNGGAGQGSVPGVVPGNLLQERRQIVTEFRGDADSAEAGYKRAGGFNLTVLLPHMSENNEEGPPLEPGGQALLTRKEVARLLRRSVGTVDNWRKHEGLPSIKKGRTVYFVWADVKAWLKKGPKKAGHRKSVVRKPEAKRRVNTGVDGPLAREVRGPGSEGRRPRADGRAGGAARREGAAKERRAAEVVES